MSGKILTLPEAIARARLLREAGRRVVLTNGCFDLLHPGHVRYLAAARAEGDTLMVAVNSDRSVGALKGPARPVVAEAERMEVVAALASVDYVFPFDEDTPAEIVRQIRPDVLVKGADWPADEIVGRDEVEAYGGRVVRIPVAEGFSTSGLVRRIVERFGRQRRPEV